MDTENLVHLLFVHDSLNEVESVGDILRNKGYALRSRRVEDGEDLQEVLDSSSDSGSRVDLVFCSMELETFTLDEAVEIVRNHGDDIPVVGIAGQESMEDITAGMKVGASDVVMLSQPEHLAFVSIRELEHLRDRRQIKEWQHAYQLSERRARVLLDTSRDSITYVRDGMHMYANPAYLRTFGYADLEDLEGMPVMDMVETADQEKLKHILREVMTDMDRPSQLEVKAQRQDGASFNVSMEFAAAAFEEEECIQITIHDHTVTRELAAKVRDLKKRDTLTDLLNRQAFMLELKRKLRSESDEWAIAYMDLDSFSRIREIAGITGTDSLLKDVSVLIGKELDCEFIGARFSDHVFVILLKLVDPQIVEALCDSLRQAVEKHIVEMDGRSVATTSSIGATLLAYSDGSEQHCLGLVEKACDDAKADGGNSVTFVNPKVKEEVEDGERKWGMYIRSALTQNRFRLHYQPIGSLHGDVAERFEVMVRMVNEKGDLLFPDRFMPAAERFGLTVAIDRWVLANTMNVLAHRLKSGRESTFFVRVGTATLLDGAFVGWMVGRFKAFGITGKNLVLEINAEEASGHLREAMTFMQQIRKLGCGIAVDKFSGTPSGVQMLSHLPFGYIKVSGSVVRGLSNSKNAAALKAIVGAAKQSKAVTVATQVEDANALAALWSSGVDFIQGDFLQEPAEHLNYDFVGEMMSA